MPELVPTHILLAWGFSEIATQDVVGLFIEGDSTPMQQIPVALGTDHHQVDSCIGRCHNIGGTCPPLATAKFKSNSNTFPSMQKRQVSRCYFFSFSPLPDVISHTNC